jgi:hypothetical protein
MAAATLAPWFAQLLPALMNPCRPSFSNSDWLFSKKALTFTMNTASAVLPNTNRELFKVYLVALVRVDAAW